jgi:hypothetical protein
MKIMGRALPVSLAGNLPQGWKRLGAFPFAAAIRQKVFHFHIPFPCDIARPCTLNLWPRIDGECALPKI